MTMGRPRDFVRAKDPIVRHLLEAVDASGHPDTAIIAKAGCNDHALHLLRTGARTGRLTTIAALAGAVGLRLKLVRGE